MHPSTQSEHTAAFCGGGEFLVRCIASYLDARLPLRVAAIAPRLDSALEVVLQEVPSLLFVELRGPDPAKYLDLPGAEFINQVRTALGVKVKIVAYTIGSLDPIFPQLMGLRANAVFSTDDPPAEWLRGLSVVLDGRDFVSGVFAAAAERRKHDPIARSLSNIQKDILPFLGTGLSAKEIARSMGTSPRAVRWHIEEIRRKLGVRDVSEIAAICKVWGYAKSSGPQAGGGFPGNMQG